MKACASIYIPTISGTIMITLEPCEPDDIASSGNNAASATQEWTFNPALFEAMAPIYSVPAWNNVQ